MQLKFNLFEDMEREDTLTDVRDKQCTVCEEVFPETEENFYIAFSYISKDGTSNKHLQNKCKACCIKAEILTPATYQPFTVSSGLSPVPQALSAKKTLSLSWLRPWSWDIALTFVVA